MYVYKLKMGFVRKTITMGFPSSTKIQYSHDLLHHLRYKREVVITTTNNISLSLNCTMEAIYTLQYTLQKQCQVLNKLLHFHLKQITNL